MGTQVTLDTDGGVNPNNTNLGEWLSYNINVQRNGDYTFTPRVAVNAAGAAFDIYVDNNKVGTVIQNQATGGLQNWVTGAPVQINLPEGQHSLKLQITASGMNINWFELSFLQGEAE
ncbi:carbohydrate-binding protein [Neobacillus cucumis]|uniref:carbohydrate-binding protein n=1 Tax=Neobacillus cucumis TaxID=1740721 RepID=UPI0027DA3A79|nr:carbohydrate-binding protein [Neobacillus cucumis]